MNQAITFLTDGGDSVRDLTEGHSPLAEHILDWFHITMRLTVLNQMAKGVSTQHKGEEFEKELERVKWFLWHGNLYKALQVLDGLALDIDEEASIEAGKLARTLHEFDHYIRTNPSSLPNYGDRYHNEEAISSAVAESAVNEIIRWPMRIAPSPCLLAGAESIIDEGESECPNHLKCLSLIHMMILIYGMSWKSI